MEAGRIRGEEGRGRKFETLLRQKQSRMQRSLSTFAAKVRVTNAAANAGCSFLKESIFGPIYGFPYWHGRPQPSLAPDPFRFHLLSIEMPETNSSGLTEDDMLQTPSSEEKRLFIRHRSHSVRHSHRLEIV